jgi:hypothetical protein
VTSAEKRETKKTSINNPTTHRSHPVRSSPRVAGIGYQLTMYSNAASPPSPSHSRAASETWTPTRRPSLEPEREILSTRGQNLPGLLRERSLSVPPATARDEYVVEHGDSAPFRNRRESLPVSLRGMTLIGASNPKYRWYETFISQLWHIFD